MVDSQSRRVEFPSFALPDECVATNKKFANNHIKTNKYNILTVVPKNLYEQFQRVANLYFLFYVVTAWVGMEYQLYKVPADPTTSAMVLAVMISISCITAATDDRAKAKRDREMSAQLVSLVVRKCDSRDLEDATDDQQWGRLIVGDMVVVKSDEPFPADLVLLASATDDGICYVDTANLDGETNLKIKMVINEVQLAVENRMPENPLMGTIEAEKPCRSIHTFVGNITLHDDDIRPLSFDQLLLRGSTLRNTAWVLGVVVYTGPETRIAMNSRTPEAKMATIERTTNKSFICVFLVVIFLCVFGDVSFWISWQWLKDYWYLKGDSESDSVLPVWITQLMTMYFLYYSMIPMSLYASLEMCNKLQAFFIEKDNKMVDPETERHAITRSTNLCQELGQVQYIFSDKTGTLTQNVMELKQICVSGKVYGSLDGSCEPFSAELLKALNRMSNQELAPARIFLENLAVNHTVMVERDENDKVVYLPESPDEGALVKGAAQCGWTLDSHTKTQTGGLIKIREQGEPFTVVGIHSFNSDRKRTSVVVQRNAEVYLLIKGAENKIMERSLNGGELQWVWQNLHSFSVVGLRCLVLAWRPLSTAVFEEWQWRYGEALKAMVNRDQALDEVAEWVEKDLRVLGITAIEDKLQDHLPETVTAVREAGIQLWVLTGDKLETARNIGFNSGVLTPDMKLEILEDGNNIDMKFEKLVQDFRLVEQAALLLTDKALAAALVSSRAKALLLEVVMMSNFKAVVCCRVSPAQKAEVVQLVRENVKPAPVTLAIGDGANDVPMIQAAQVGIGISGKEGRQAVNSSDFAIGQFHFLRRLLFVHGRWNYRRTAKLFKYTIFRSAVFCLSCFWYQFSTAFSGTQLFNESIYSLVVCMFTLFLPPLASAAFEKDVTEEFALRYPTVYSIGRLGSDLNTVKIAQAIVSAFAHSLLVYIVVLFLHPENYLHNVGTMWMTLYVSQMLAYLWYTTHTTNRYWWFMLLLNILLYIGCVYGYGELYTLSSSTDFWYLYKVPSAICNNNLALAMLVVVPLQAIMLDMILESIRVEWCPDAADLAIEINSGVLRMNKDEQLSALHRLETLPELHSGSYSRTASGSTSSFSKTVSGSTSTFHDQRFFSDFDAPVYRGNSWSSLSLRTTTGNSQSSVLRRFLRARPRKDKCWWDVRAIRRARENDTNHQQPSIAQQTIPEFRHVYSAKRTATCVAVMCIIQALFAWLFLHRGNMHVSHWLQYHEGNPGLMLKKFYSSKTHWDKATCRLGTECKVNLTLKSDMRFPIEVAYRLSRFYQNNQEYVGSVFVDQLTGKQRGSREQQAKQCLPKLKGEQNKTLFPCGLVANSMFNDTFEIEITHFPVNSSKKGNFQLRIDDQPQSQKPQPDGRLFDNTKDYNSTGTNAEKYQWLYETYPGIVNQSEGVRNVQFERWMLPDAFATLVKHVGWIHEVAETGSMLPTGTELTLTIRSNFPVHNIHSDKTLILFSTADAMFPRDTTGMGYFCVICAASAMLFLVYYVIFLQCLGFARSPGQVRTRKRQVAAASCGAMQEPLLA